MVILSYNVILIIFIGVGVVFGGYVGDVLSIVRAIFQVCDCFIIYFNVLNGVQFYYFIFNVFYVEGYVLDCFVQGDWGLIFVGNNVIGLILD